METDSVLACRELRLSVIGDYPSLVTIPTAKTVALINPLAITGTTATSSVH